MRPKSFEVNSITSGKGPFLSPILKAILLVIAVNLITIVSFGQVTTNGGSGLDASYPSLSDAITALNAATISSPVEITLTTDETAPSTGYVITASGTSTNTITIKGGGNTVTAGTGYTAGSLTDGIFKLKGADWITIDNFVMQENPLNTDASVLSTGNTNSMTEWGVALLYATTTNGSQNCTIKNNTISLGSYNNTFGIYSNSTHSSTDVSTYVEAVAPNGGNDGLKVYGNLISGVSRGILVVGPFTRTSHLTGIDIGGNASNTGNVITGFGAETMNNFYFDAGAASAIWLADCKDYNISYNSITSKNGTVAANYNGIHVFNYFNSGTINNNSIDIYSGSDSYHTINGIYVSGFGSAANSSELAIKNNNFTRLTFSTSTATGAITGITQIDPVKTMRVNGNHFTNLSVENGEGRVSLISVTYKMPADGLKEISNNKIVGTFTETRGGSGSYMYCIYDAPTLANISPATATHRIENNDFSNITFSGCGALAGHAFNGIKHSDGGIRIISHNTISNVTNECLYNSVTMGMEIARSDNGLVSDNIIKNLNGLNGVYGIRNDLDARTTDKDIFRANVISGLRTPANGYADNSLTGILVRGGAQKILERNSISDLEIATGGGSSCGGIIVISKEVIVQNNVVGNLRAPNASGYTTVFGISVGYQGILPGKIYNNTVYLNAVPNDLEAIYGTAGLFVSSAAVSTSVRNNILVNLSTPGNGGGWTEAYSRQGPLSLHTVDSDRNLYYVGTTAENRRVVSDAVTLAGFRTLLGNAREANSIYEAPHFLNTSSGSKFLRIDTSYTSNVIGGASVIATVTDDVDGDKRSATPTIGADEVVSGGLEFQGNLKNFTYCPSVPSKIQQFSLRGSGLIADVTVTPPNGFEIRKSGDTNFETTLILPKDGNGILDSTALDIRVAATASGNYTGFISATSGEFEDTLNISGSGSSLTFYKDADNDGYSDGTTSIGCTAPEGYKIDSTLKSMTIDCDDTDSSQFPGQKWYVDGDGDGFVGDSIVQCSRPVGALLSSELAGQNLSLGDCDDTNSEITNGVLWYIDADGDGYVGEPVRSCERPTGGFLSSELDTEGLQSGDCDDSDPKQFPGQQWYVDGDTDGYVGDAQTSCTRPTDGLLQSELAGANKQTGDCDDTDAAINPATVWYLDADADGYYTGTGIAGCTSPGEGYTDGEVQSGDCDDADPAVNPTLVWYLDADGDGYYTGSGETGCEAPGEGYVTSGVQSGDCDDADASINPETIWYKDADDDGYSDGTTLTQCTQPADHKLASALTSMTLDCDDDDATLNPATIWYLDADADGYYTGSGISSCTSPGTGYTTTEGTSGDCDDSNASFTLSILWYKDADNDGYSDGTTESTCTRPVGYKLAGELTATSGDCDDTNAALNPATVWYKDSDNDGYSNGTTQTQCSQPTGYKLATALTATSGDCNDNDATLNPNTSWYKDSDNDGYSDGTTVKQCTQPTSYKLAASLTRTSGDCDDNNAAINPSSGTNVQVVYTGAYFSSTTNNSATVTLSATVKVPAGTDVTKSQVKFINRDNGQYITANWVKIGLVNQSDKTTGTATAQYTISLSSTEDARQITIGIEVGGDNSCFSRNNSDDNVVINISKPVGDFVTGGGFMIASSSGGVKAADNCSKTNFGFNAKYNKTLKNIQGNVNMIIRRTEGGVLKVYQVKSNNFSSLSSVSATATMPAQATLNGKAIIQDITNPNNTISIDGNGTLQMTMVDMGEPGKYDVLGITVWNKDGGMWYASNWNGTKTVEQQIAKGNIQVNQPQSAIGSIQNTMTITSSAQPSSLGSPVSFTAAITEADAKANPTGYIIFYDNDKLLGYAQISASSKAVLTTAALSTGYHTITAYYRGDTKFKPSESFMVQQVSSAPVPRISLLSNSLSAGEISLKQEELAVKVFGNPSANFFTLRVLGNNKEPMAMRISNVSGQPIKFINGLTNGQFLEVGSEFGHGMFFAELVQGKRRVVVKLIKIK